MLTGGRESGTGHGVDRGKHSFRMTNAAKHTFVRTEKRKEKNPQQPVERMGIIRHEE